MIKSPAKIWSHGESAEFPRIDREIESIADHRLTAAERPVLTIEDRALYIYTSGTTGLPKAANINHYRVMLASHAFAGVMDTKPTDRMYDCLPMYHTAGGLVATGATLLNGGSVVLREKFSAREFWDDVVRYECTMFQYIGELCRYLAHAPPNPNETKHRIRLCCGNGLRPDLWDDFKARFRIPLVLEFYGATEGNVNIFNFEGKPGAVGRVPWFVAHRFPIAVVRYDVEKQQPERTADGFCVRCDPNEPGEVIGKIINDASKPGNRFEGYAASGQNEHKILRDVFKKGDSWFRTGDLMRKDERGYFYFVDRVGDTFRWKGENVSTSEVSEAINSFPGIVDANVYGVTIAGREGRAGMAAIVYQGGCDLKALHAHLRTHLPDYARPLFLRIQEEIDVTGTFKQKKVDLVKDGFRPLEDRRCDLFQRSAVRNVRAARSRALSADREGRNSPVIETPQAVLAFWRKAGPKRWFTKSAAFDRQIRAQVSANLQGRRRSERFRIGSANRPGTLALAIVLDQFPRNMFRRSARAFAADPLARQVARRAIAKGFDRRVPPGERQFLYLPFEHSESLADQQRCVALFRATGDAESLKWAQLHADIIRRFGRFPHRNAALGRATTARERAFLDGGGFTG